MNITAEKLQFASVIDAKVKSIGRPGGDDFTIFAEMATTCQSHANVRSTIQVRPTTLKGAAGAW